MSAQNTDLLRKGTPLFATQLSGPIGSSDTTIPLQSVAGLPLDTAVTITIDATDANDNLTPNAKETVTGVVNSGTSSLVTCLRGRDGTTQQAHITGANVVQWFTADDWNDLITAYLVNHTQQGYHQSLKDTNGNLWLSQVAANNAVNYISVANAASGSAVESAAHGSDTNIDYKITPQGNGKVIIPNGSLSAIGLTNPYKFSVYRNAAANASNTPTVLQFDTKLFDTGTNVDVVTNKGRFTAPVAGFYQLEWQVGISIGGTDNLAMLYKNGSVFAWGNEGSNTGSNGSILVQSAANDYWEVYVVANTTVALNVGASPIRTYFSGYLVSVT